MSETFGKDIMESVKDAIGTDIEDFIDPASIKKDLGDEMKKDLDLELKAIDEDKEMNSIEKNFKKAFLKLKNSVLGGIFGWDKESKEDEETAENIPNVSPQSWRKIRIAIQNTQMPDGTRKHRQII